MVGILQTVKIGCLPSTQTEGGYERGEIHYNNPKSISGDTAIQSKQSRMPGRRVVIAIDWSEYAEKAFDWYIYNLHRKGYFVILAHYIEATTQEEWDKKELKLQELQEAYENVLLQMKVDFRWVTGSGCSPGEHIIRTAKEEQADMIIMGARGLGVIKKTILGSVSDYVMNKAKVPVMICKWDKK